MNTITIKTSTPEIGHLIKALLEKIQGVEIISNIEEEIVGYKVDGSPVYTEGYKKNVSKRLKEIELGKRKTYSSEEMKSKIFNYYY